MSVATLTKRRCPRCGETEPKARFYTTPSVSYCRSCWSEYRKNYPRNHALVAARRDALELLAQRHFDEFDRLYQLAKTNRGLT